jgi:CTP-dependent riboflavin kinase
MKARLSGTIFSDLGQASLFMGLSWVRDALTQKLGYSPYPATLNVRPKTPEDAKIWHEIQASQAGVRLSAVDSDFCNARLYFVTLQDLLDPNQAIKGAVLLPEIADYPRDKIEVVAPVHLKDAFSLADGDQLVVEFDA